jgi:hypothetical protein
VVNGNAGSDNIWASPSVTKRLEIRGGAGHDSVRGGSSHDTLYGGTGGNAVADESGRDTIDAGGGSDVIVGSAFSRSTLYGGVGNDTLIGSSQTDSIYGGAGNDTLFGQGGNDFLYSGSDHDLLDGGAGADQLYGADGHDTLRGAAGNDSLYGEAGNDALDGGANSDLMDGGFDNDYLVPDTYFSFGADRSFGGAGWDTVDFSSRVQNLSITLDGLFNDGAAEEADNVGADIEAVIGGSGNDLISGTSLGNWIEGREGNDTIRAGDGNDTVFGGSGDDALHGEGGHDWIEGGGESDKLYGGAGDDTLYGQAGNDILVSIGGGNKDRLYGGSGHDSFWMDVESTETHDASSAENGGRAVHRVSAFSNGASKELNGQNLSDPLLQNALTETWVTMQATDSFPLFSSQGPHADDIRQGGLGDCWFLATLAAVAHKDPDVIRQSVVEMGDGTYAAMFYEDGERRYYRVDNDLPEQRDLPLLTPNGTLAYAKPGIDGAMWVPILEKAYALHDGSGGGEGEYDGIAGGWSDNAFSDMGIGSVDYDVDDEGVLQQIANHLAAGRPITIDTVHGEFEPGDSIVASHVYTVISVDVAHGSITVRNPWGTDAYNGTGTGNFVFGPNDGYVTFSFNQAFRDLTDDFTVGYV